jgi:SNF2 family DNA or RNA helicase
VLVFHGSRDNIDRGEIEKSDMVLTTYSTVVSEWASRKPLLHEKHWFRIVLDEGKSYSQFNVGSWMTVTAHFLRERSTKRSRAICALKGERRWALTGTPIQNKIDDLCGLFKVLQVRPFNNYIEFREQISKPLQMGDPDGLCRLRSVLRSVALRRTREIVELPPRRDVVEELELSEEEQELYEVCRKESLALIDTMLGTNDYTNRVSMIQSMLRQRQVCSHGTDLLPGKMKARLNRRRRVHLLEGNPAPEQGFPIFCEGCDNEIEVTDNSVGTFVSCFHVVCSKCLSSMDPDFPNTCPICETNEGRTRKANRKANSMSEWLAQLDYSGPSTKVVALIENIRNSQAQRSSEPVKR